MGKSFEALLPEHEAFIANQHIFFVGSAPLSAEGHVNISPKGHDVFRILSSTEVAYLDLTGSGNETSAHLAENGRITVMFMATQGPPQILRLYGKGRVVLQDSSEWAQLAPRFNPLPGVRQIMVVEIHEVKSSCGYSIPFYTYEGERNTLQNWAAKQGDDGLLAYWQNKNMTSMDGLPTPIGQKLSTNTM
ncbi:pyridoxamine 5'-phosphate oxidase family protein [Paenibacillus roseipurpureus]|uniref:Pyridoxamine 5'-phosphate oxidase family protein n=1 Tax=Paenibacillus roseopurpureus TaxID=2918901 RepID=A0AA96RL29_9BACL|nr:pyridoxamine 5'-phosphate oxidase family protein [Paenibacillus sp. MBLB1832]WNR44931.1 pyridoxamine 5'-phosphate oxidase family protein [Paenibacillus sp. MBLB1832]